MDYGFTAEMEKSLDEVAEGKEDWKKLLESFYKDFTEAKENASQTMERNAPINTDVDCYACGKRKMHLRTNQNGQFLGCEGYSNEGDDQCKKTYSLISDELLADNDDKEAENIFKKTKCDVCGASMHGYIIDDNKKLYICSKSPICSGTKLEEGKFIKPKSGEEELIDCHKCESKMELKLGRFGKYHYKTKSKNKIKKLFIFF